MNSSVFMYVRLESHHFYYYFLYFAVAAVASSSVFVCYSKVYLRASWQSKSLRFCRSAVASVCHDRSNYITVRLLQLISQRPIKLRAKNITQIYVFLIIYFRNSKKSEAKRNQHLEDAKRCALCVAIASIHPSFSFP